MPVGVLLPTVMVIAEEPVPGEGIEVGFNLMVVPEGAPDVERLMEELNPQQVKVVTVPNP